MLENMHQTIRKKHPNPLKAWDHLIEFIAIDNCSKYLVNNEININWLKNDKKLFRKLIKIYDIRLLRKDYEDTLGQFYINKIKKHNRTKKPDKYLELEKFFLEYDINKIPKTKRQITVLDKEVGTGKKLLAVYKRAPNAFMFGITNNLRNYRIAMTNMAIHKTKSLILYADTEKHEYEITKKEGKENWLQSNQWNPKQEKLKTKTG